jgi:hypothetical protein
VSGATTPPRDGFGALAPALDALLCDGVLADHTTLHLPANVPPWTPTPIRVDPGDAFSWLADGRVVISPELDLSGGPRFHLWGRIAPGGAIFNAPGDTGSFVAERGGRLELAIYHGEWKTPAGELATPADAYATLRGGIDVCVLRWRRVPGTDPRAAALAGLNALARLAPAEALVAAALHALEQPAAPPPGWRHLWFLGESAIFREARDDAGRPAIRLEMSADLAILHKPADFPVEPDSTVTWRWKVDALPARVAEDTFPTHDYLSLAVAFDDGRDLSWYWSAALPERRHFACPIPTWTARETHLVVRSGAAGLGAWQEEERSLFGDCLRVYGAAPKRVVGVWLIAVSTFRRGRGAATFSDVRLRSARGALQVL